MENKKNMLFLLGGHDLEMEEIKKMLDEHGIPYLDKNLSWGAKLEDYDDSLKEMLAADRIYGIELSGYIEDLTSRLEDYLGELDEELDDVEYEIDYMPGGDNDDNYDEYHAIEKEISLTSELVTKLDNGSLSYEIIDHHNEYSDRKSSIEQVADIIGVQLNRHQQLVAANDSGYIPAMKEMGATDEEIAEIRRLDRQAQGVTEAEEKIAEEAMAKMVTPKKYAISLGSVEVDEGISVDDEREVYTPAIVRIPDELSHFSPITDKLFGTESIIIYNNHEFCYYGPGAHWLGKEVMADEVAHGKAYFGGSKESGFFGTAYDALEINDVIKKTCKSFDVESAYLISSDPNCPEEYKDLLKDIVNQYTKESLARAINWTDSDTYNIWSHKPYTVTDIVYSESDDITSLKITNGEGQISEVPVKDGKIIFDNLSFNIYTGLVKTLSVVAAEDPCVRCSSVLDDFNKAADSVERTNVRNVTGDSASGLSFDYDMKCPDGSVHERHAVLKDDVLTFYKPGLDKPICEFNVKTRELKSFVTEQSTGMKIR